MNLDGLFEESLPKEAVGGPQPVEIRPVSIEARRAVEKEILPSKPEDMSIEEFAQEMSAILKDAVQSKNDWYIRLIRYKAIDEGDETFFDDLVYVLNERAKKLRQPVVPVEGDEEESQEPEEPIQALKDDLIQALKPNMNLTPWALTSSLNEIFQRRRIAHVKAQVVPAPIEKLSTSEPGVQKKARFLVAVTLGAGFKTTQVDLRHHPGWGWCDLMGVESPQDSARNLVKHIVDSVFEEQP